MSTERPGFYKFEVRLANDDSGAPYEGIVHNGWNAATRAARVLTHQQLGDFIGRMPNGSSIFVVADAKSTQNQMATSQLASSKHEVLQLVDRNLPVIFSLNGTRDEVEQLIGSLPLKARVD